MKKIVAAFCFVCSGLIACNNQVKSDKLTSADSSQKILKSDTAARVPVKKNSSQKKEVSNGIKNEILGIWAFVGDENATFVIGKDKITYPDQNASYKYFISNDSLLIKFLDFDGHYLVKTRGSDTLVLVGDEEQVYYRFKKQ